jgi:hypothetical protein
VAQYRLLAPHVTTDGQLLDMGLEVGDNTSIPWKNVDGSNQPPSTQMIGLDAEGTSAVEQLWKTLYGKPPPWDAPGVKESIKAKEDEYKKQVEEEKNSEPVSEQQAREKEIAKLEEETEGKYSASTKAAILRSRQTSSTATASQTRGGVEHHAEGVINPFTMPQVAPLSPGQQHPQQQEEVPPERSPNRAQAPADDPKRGPGSGATTSAGSSKGGNKPE